MTAASRNSVNYQKFLRRVARANPIGRIVVITDDLSARHSKSTREWLEGCPRIQHVFIPKGACWLNLQEGWWRLFRKTALAGQSFVDPSEIARVTRIAPASSTLAPNLNLGTSRTADETTATPIRVPPLRNAALARAPPSVSTCASSSTEGSR